MPRQVLTQEVNKLVAGLITEVSPLTFPENASIDEVNFILNKDGTRNRRLGMDYEDGFQKKTIEEAFVFLLDPGTSTFVWRNAGSIADKTLLVVQRGTTILFYDMDVIPLSAGLIHSVVLTGVNGFKRFYFTVVDSTLIMATGRRFLQSFNYDPDADTVNTDSFEISTRDVFSVSDSLALEERPLVEGVTDAHVYNLRNQGWAIPRLVFSADIGPDLVVMDPLARFSSKEDTMPSNGDNINLAIFPDPEDDKSPLLDKFHRNALLETVPVPAPSPVGHFIISALERGSSRLSEEARLRTTYPSIGFGVTSLPQDKTPGGATCVNNYAGRVWYGGFSGEVIGGDDNSPNLASYVFFSQLVQNQTDIPKCYQELNPTDGANADSLATDGGFVQLAGAYGIKAMLTIGQSLIVVADNGVWEVRGGNDLGFDATNILVSKITSHGAVSAGSVIEVDSTLMYWGSNGIYHIAPNSIGTLEATNLTSTTIQTFYDNIGHRDREASEGIYEESVRKVRWLYGNSSFSDSNKELVLDLTLGAFYPNTFSTDGSEYPKVLSAFKTKPFLTGVFADDVINVEDQVLFGTEDVQLDTSTTFNVMSETKYLVQTGAGSLVGSPPTLVHDLTFAAFIDTKFEDWTSEYGTGVDAPAHVITGWGPGGDFHRNKQTPWISFHFLKTELGFEDDGTGTLVPINPGGCLVQAQWDWANSASSNRWGVEFQAYRHKRYYIPADDTDTFNDGNLLVSTKNKVRGKGKVLSLHIRSEPRKDLRFLGMSTIIEVDDYV